MSVGTIWMGMGTGHLLGYGMDVGTGIAIYHGTGRFSHCLGNTAEIFSREALENFEVKDVFDNMMCTSIVFETPC